MFTYCNNNLISTIDREGGKALIPELSISSPPIVAGSTTYYVNVTFYRTEGDSDEIDITASSEGAEVSFNGDGNSFSLGVDVCNKIDFSAEKEIVENSLYIFVSLQNGMGIKYTKQLSDTLTMEVTITRTASHSTRTEKKQSTKSSVGFWSSAPSTGGGSNAVFGSSGGVYANQMGGCFTPVWGRNFLAIV